MNPSSVYIFSATNPEPDKPLSPHVFGKAKHGDQAAFGEIYNLFFKRIYRFIYFRVSHKEAAEDLAEEIFLKAFGKISSVRDGDALQAWLYQIARNAVIDYYREKKSDVPLDEIENTLEYESNIVDAVSLSQDQQMFMLALKQLPAEQQIIIKLKFIEDLDNSAIAEMLHKSEGAIRVIQHRAIIKLQELISQRLNRQ